MRIGLLATALGIALCMTVGMVRVYGNNWTLASGISQDDTWTVIEYADGQEVTVELKPGASLPDAKGTARVIRSGKETTISLDVSGVTGDETAYQVYVVDSLGSATELGTLTITDGSGTLSAKTALSKFMIIISSEAELTAVGSETKVVLRSTVPSGFTVVAKEESGEPESAEPSASNAQMEPARAETPEYDVPLLGIASLRRGADTTMRANFSSGFEGIRAAIVVKPQKNGPTQIKMRFTNLKQAPEGMQYILWQVAPDTSYSVLGRLTNSGKKDETKVDATTALPDFGLFITTESAEANPASPAGSLVATIVK
jgi:hypothetical protein